MKKYHLSAEGVTCTPLHLTNVVVYGVLNATSHLFGQGYLYLTDAQIIKKVLVGPVPRAST